MEDKIEEKLRCSIDLVMHMIQSNQRQQVAREKFMMSIIDLKLNALMKKFPFDTQLQESLTSVNDSFLKEMLKLRDADSLERGRLLEAAKRISKESNDAGNN